MSPPTRQDDSVMSPVSESLAGVYARALLEQLPSDREAEEVAAELDGLAKLLDEVEGFEQLLTAALISNNERCAVVERVFHGRVSEPVEAALSVMAAAGRLGLLRAVRRAFRSALNRRQGKREVTVTTAVPLGDAQRRQIAEALAEMLHAECVLTLKVEPAVLGGMVVRIDDHIYDASVRTDLRKLQHRLKKEIKLDAPPAGEQRR